MIRLRNFWARLRDSLGKARTQPVVYGKVGPCCDLPKLTVCLSKVTADVIASVSGPDGGIHNIKNCVPNWEMDWNRATLYAAGQSISLYDRAAETGARNGEPIADCFGILAYQHGAVLAVADGVNWGEPPRRAARCAILGCLHHMQVAIQSMQGSSDLRTSDVFKHILHSLHSGQKLILQQFGTLTTLVVSAVCKCKWLNRPQQWALMTVTVGDSAAYVYRHKTGKVEEVTYGSHADTIRDPRFCPGALGYALGEEPDFTNLSCSVTFLSEGDVVFLASDGVSDNFDPVLLRTAKVVPPSVQVAEAAESEIPVLTANQAQEVSLKNIEKAIDQYKTTRNVTNMNAQQLVDCLIEHVVAVTTPKRDYVESRSKDREKFLSTGDDNSFFGTVLNLPGKLDHATVAAYQVGIHAGENKA